MVRLMHVHCRGETVSSSFGTALRETKLIDLVHFGYLDLDNGNIDKKCILIIKNYHSQHSWFFFFQIPQPNLQPIFSLIIVKPFLCQADWRPAALPTLKKSPSVNSPRVYTFHIISLHRTTCDKTVHER